MFSNHETFVLVKFSIFDQLTSLCNTTALIEVDNKANTKGVMACYFEEMKFVKVKYQLHASDGSVGISNPYETSETKADDFNGCLPGHRALDYDGVPYATDRDIFVIIRVRKVSFLCDTRPEGHHGSMMKQHLRIDHFYTSVTANGALDDILSATNERCQNKVDSSSNKTLLQLWCQSEESNCQPNILFESRDTMPVKFDQKPVAVIKLENHADEANSEIVDYYWDTNHPGVFIDFQDDEFSMTVSGNPAEESKMYTLTFQKSQLVQMHIDQMFNLNQITSLDRDAYDQIDCGSLEKKYRYCFGSYAFIDGQATSTSFDNIRPQIGIEIDYIFGIGEHEFTHQHEIKPPHDKLIKLAERMTKRSRN